MTQIRRNEIYQQRAEETTSKFEQKQKHFEELVSARPLRRIFDWNASYSQDAWL